HGAPRVAAGGRRAGGCIPHPQRAGGPRDVTYPIVLLGFSALVAFAIRKRIALAGPFTIAVLLAAIVFIVSADAGATAEALALQLRLSPLAQLGGPVLLRPLALLVLPLCIDEPAHH